MARDPIKAKIKRNAKGKIIATTLTPKDYETLKNSDYWLARQAEHDIALQKDYEQTIANMQKMYWREANRLDQLIANYFTKYGKDNVIKYSDLMKKLKPDERKQLIESADEYLSAHPEQQAIVDVRKSIYKLNRLEGLRASLEIQAANMAVIEQSRAEQFLRNAYTTSYGQMAEDLGMGKQFNFYDPNVMNATINQKWVSEEAFSDRIWKNRTSLANYIQRDFAQGVARGEDYKQLSKAMTNRFRTQSETNIRRVINTEYIRIQNEAKAESMEYLGDLAWYKIHEDYTKPDTMCQEMDGKSFRLKDRETGRNCPPFHPNCHGFIAPDSNHFPTKEEYEKQMRKASIKADRSGKIKVSDKPYNELTLGKISMNNWSQAFKEKTINFYKYAHDHDVEFSYHSLARVIDRGKNENGLSDSVIINAAKSKPKYVQVNNKRFIHPVANNVYLVENADTGDIVSVIERKNPKKEWREIKDD